MKHDPYAKIEKVVVNTGIGRLAVDPSFSEKILPGIIEEFGAITGQRPSPRSAKKSISGFKLREGTVVGLMATLRGRRMRQFLEKLFSIVFPRVRDFRGINLTAVDAQGNLSFGFKEHLVFPEVSPERSKTNFGIQVTVVPKAAKNREVAIELYRSFKVPFKKNRLK